MEKMCETTNRYMLRFFCKLAIYSKKTHPDEFLPQTIQSGMCFAYNALYLEPHFLGVLYDIYRCLNISFIIWDTLW